MPITIEDYLKRGPATSKEIQVSTGLSQPAVSRKLKEMGDSVIKLRDGRTQIYAATCNAFGGSNKLPLSLVDVQGNTTLVAYLRPLVNKGFFVEPVSGMPPLFAGDKGNGLYSDLPYFLLDLAPQGFLGKQIAAELASQSGNIPADPRYWTTDHIGRFLLSNGEDLPGNLKLGEQALLRIRHKPLAVSDDAYPSLADNVLNGIIPGSSVGGEQPKFTAFSAKSSSHVIVKFSPKGDSATARRWRDILLTEFHAAKTICNYGFPAAETRLIELDGRFFLESQRFDRSGKYGRMSMVSLQSIDAEYSGTGGGWPQALDALYRRHRISWEHVYDAETLWCFGRLINNTDMHLGNLSFAMDGDMFRLLPLYDMCSMGFAPKSNGEVSAYNFVPAWPKMINIPGSVADSIKGMAFTFWKRVANDERISEEFRTFLKKGNPVDSIPNR